MPIGGSGRKRATSAVGNISKLAQKSAFMSLFNVGVWKRARCDTVEKIRNVAVSPLVLRRLKFFVARIKNLVITTATDRERSVIS